MKIKTGVKEKITISLTDVNKQRVEVFIQDGLNRIQKIGSVKHVK